MAALDQPQEQEMSFLDHLEALRWHIIRAVIAILIFTIVAFIYIEKVFNILLGPGRTDFWTYRMLCKYFSLCPHDMGFSLQNTDMAGQFTQSISMAVYVGLTFAFPYAFWELWRFFRPALSSKEKGYARGIVFFSSILFLCGLLLGFYIITPITVQFLGNYKISPQVENRINLESFLDTVTTMTFSTALTFELPIVVYFLAIAGFLTPKTMRKYRRHAILVSLVASAVITPSTDMTSMLVLAIPFVFLYEFSILVAAFVVKRKAKSA
jgi:sec-independent protein translocase protein TatC